MNVFGYEVSTRSVFVALARARWAWADIQRDVAHLALGGDFSWINKPGSMVSCCTDGLRPVVFKLERAE